MRLPAKLLSLLLLFPVMATAEPIVIPNFSFEKPPVTRDGLNPFGALPFIDEWDETNVGLLDEWDQDTGNFINTDAGEPDHITNLDLLRAAFVSSLTGNAIRQDLPHAYLPGRSYRFTIAVGKSFTFPVGDTEQLEIALFYFDPRVEEIVASTFVSGAMVNSTTVTDFSVTSAIVEEGDAWAGRPIGILVRPYTLDPDDDTGEGFWNLDYARLDELTPPNADGDGDGDVDLVDLAMIENCLSEVDAACATFDLNSDLAIDLDDLLLFLDDLGGPLGE